MSPYVIRTNRAPFDWGKSFIMLAIGSAVGIVVVVMLFCAERANLFTRLKGWVFDRYDTLKERRRQRRDEVGTGNSEASERVGGRGV
jgi:hypothetical protein